MWNTLNESDWKNLHVYRAIVDTISANSYYFSPAPLPEKTSNFNRSQNLIPSPRNNTPGIITWQSVFMRNDGSATARFRDFRSRPSRRSVSAAAISGIGSALDFTSHASSRATCTASGFKSFGRYSVAHVVTPSARTNKRILSTHGHVGASHSIRYFISYLSLDDKNYTFAIARYMFFPLPPCVYFHACTPRGLCIHRV